VSKDFETMPPPGGQFLVYQTADGKLKIDVRLNGETVWLNQFLKLGLARKSGASTSTEYEIA